MQRVADERGKVEGYADACARAGENRVDEYFTWTFLQSPAMIGSQVVSLFVHPLKSAAAIPVDSIDLDHRGAAGDRRWMLVDSNGEALTARTHHRLALIRPSFLQQNRNGALRLDACGLESLTVQRPHDVPDRAVTIWDDVVAALDAGDIAAEWCSAALGTSCRLVYLADSAARPLRRKYAGALPYSDRQVMLSDGAPLLLLSVASLNALNERLVMQGEEAVTVARFRPNIVLDGVGAHEEDSWREIHIGAARIGVGAPCTRCVMTTVNPDTGEGGVEPLRTLAGYRRDPSGVVFGMNATHAGPGVIRVGDAVVVNERL